MCWLTDKHSVSMLIADISLLGVRLPRHRYHHRSAALKSLRAGATGVTGRGRTKRTLVWSVGKKAKGENYGESWSLFLSQGSKCTHILQQSPSVSCPSSQVFRPDNVEQPPAFFFFLSCFWKPLSPSIRLCTGLNFFLYSFIFAFF